MRKEIDEGEAKQTYKLIETEKYELYEKAYILLENLRKSDDVQAIQGSLNTMFECWIISDESYTKEERISINFHHKEILELLHATHFLLGEK